MSTITIIQNPEIVNKRSKHFCLADYWLHKECEARTFEPIHVASAENVADIFTKALKTELHQKFAGMIGMGLRADAR